MTSFARHCINKGIFSQLQYLQEASQLAVSIVDVLVAIFVTQGVNAVAQSQEGAIDVSSFFQSLTSILSLKEAEIDG